MGHCGEKGVGGRWRRGWRGSGEGAHSARTVALRRGSDPIDYRSLLSSSTEYRSALNGFGQGGPV